MQEVARVEAAWVKAARVVPVFAGTVLATAGVRKARVGLARRYPCCSWYPQSSRAKKFRYPCAVPCCQCPELDKPILPVPELAAGAPAGCRR